MSTTGDAGTRLKVFVSYARNDLAFVDQLVAALQFSGFDAMIDRHDIAGGESWRRRLNMLIESSDTVIPVLSPDSAGSEICNWEIEEAVRLGKRMIPVVCRELGDARPASSIADLNYVYFYPDPRVPGSGFGTGLASLVTALNSDLDWLRGHTRYLSLALAWDERGRGVDRLLTGSGLTEANAWKLRRPSGAPDLTDLHRAFFAASEAAGAAHHTDARQAALEQRVMELEAALAARSSAGSRPAPKPRGTKIFISYRRATSQALAGRICDRLEKDFARDEVFFDVDAIPIGVNFKEHIRGSLERSAVLLAIIGEGWRIGSRSGRRWWQPWARPDEDHVRSEIEVAFELGVPILPVLVDRTPMPKPSQVPGSIAAVCDLNAAAVRSGRDFHSDMDVVCSNIRELRSQV